MTQGEMLDLAELAAQDYEDAAFVSDLNGLPKKREHDMATSRALRALVAALRGREDGASGE